MDIGLSEGAVRRLTAAVSRRRLGMVAAGLAFGAPAAASAGTKKRCRKRLADCTKSSQCCGRKTRCATSHGNGSNTCCGGEGATCGSDLTCCMPLMCEDGHCVQVPPV